MVTRNRQFLPRRTSGPNRSWSGAFDATTVGAASTKVLVGALVLSNPNIDETILRVAGMFGVRSDQTSAAEDQQGAFGAIVVSDTALAAGVASIPGPITDIADDGWFLYQSFIERWFVATSVGVNPNASRRYELHSRAKRKVQEGQSIAFVVESTSASDGFILTSVFRLLSQVTGT